jgi:transposase
MEYGSPGEARFYDTFFRYDEAFKIRVVQEVESGQLSKDAARRKYGIRGKTTVLSWCRKYGREEYPYMPGTISKKQLTGDEKDQRIAELERQVQQARIAIEALESLIEVANEMYRTDLKKKVGLKRSKK